MQSQIWVHSLSRAEQKRGSKDKMVTTGGGDVFDCQKFDLVNVRHIAVPQCARTIDRMRAGIGLQK